MKTECDIKPNRLFAPQLVGLVSSMDRNGEPNVATLAWITSVSAEPPLISIAIGRSPEIPSTPSLKSTQIITPTPSKESQLEQEVKELKERLNKTEERQSQQESRISWLESAINSIRDWIKSFLG